MNDTDRQLVGHEIDLGNGYVRMEYGTGPAETPVVSVIINTYNHASYIAQAIEGAVGQKTDFPFEVLLHDDASTDGTAEICMEYAEKYPEIIRYLPQSENQWSQGVGVTVTFQYPRARGKYLAICEGDDFWQDEEKLQKQVDILEERPEVVLVHSDVNRWIEKDKKCISDFNQTMGQDVSVTPHGLLEDVLTSRYPISTLTTCFRRKALQEILSEDEEFYFNCSDRRLFGDYPLWVDLASKGMFHYIPEATATYRVLPESASHTADMRKSIAFRLHVEKVMTYLGHKHEVCSQVIQSQQQHLWRGAFRMAIRTNLPDSIDEILAKGFVPNRLDSFLMRLYRRRLFQFVLSHFLELRSQIRGLRHRTT